MWIFLNIEEPVQDRDRLLVNCTSLQPSQIVHYLVIDYRICELHSSQPRLYILQQMEETCEAHRSWKSVPDGPGDGIVCVSRDNYWGRLSYLLNSLNRENVKQLQKTSMV